MQETRVRSLGGEHHLEEGVITHSSVLAQRIPQTEEPGGLQYSMGGRRIGHDRSNLHAHMKPDFTAYFNKLFSCIASKINPTNQEGIPEF